MVEDVYFKKLLIFNFRKQSLKFKTSQELFSSHEIDSGTRFLLRTIIEADYACPRNILDMGCGYGPMGLTLKSLHRNSIVHLVDKDALAVEYTRQNAELNGFSGVEVYSSLGYDDLTKSDFDLIISNIPGKAGETVIAYLLREAAYYLTREGLVAIVVVTPLGKVVEQILSGLPGVKIILQQNRTGHTVFHYRFSTLPTNRIPQTAMERGVYTRKKMAFHFDNLEFLMQTSYGLPEFDSLDYRSEMLMSAIRNSQSSAIGHAAVFNPGQGAVPVAVWKLLQPESISVIDRDLLSLRYSKLNLILNQYPIERIKLFHQVGLELKGQENIDLWVGVLREEEGLEAMILAVQYAGKTLSPTGLIVISGSSTAITRLATYLQLHNLLRIKTREKRRGYSLLVAGH